MSTVTIPRKISGAKDDLVVIPRREYESLKERSEAVQEFTPSKADIRALRAAEKRFTKGGYHLWEDVKRDLAARRRSKRAKNTR